jgi:IclR family acetate operon transcriptional repressor
MTDADAEKGPLAGTQSLDRALLVLLTIGSSPRPGLTLSACAAILGYSKATTQRLLRTLVSRDFLQYDEDSGVYDLGVANVRLGSEYLHRLDLRSVALPTMRAIVAETRETAHLGTLSGTDVVYIELVDSPQPVRMFSRVGDAVPAYATAIGKAILAWSGDEALPGHLPGEFVARTPNTIMSTDALLAELHLTRERGFAIDNLENREGIRGYAAPIFDFSDAVVAAVSIAGPATRVSAAQDEVFGARIAAAAREISAALGAAAPGGPQ